MFNTFIVHPIINILIFIYALLPGHDFGLALIIFTILLRLAMQPLIKRSLHHGRAMKNLQPEIEMIKAATKGDASETSRLTLELYKEREVSPLASVGITFIQVAVLIGLFSGLRHIASDPQLIVTNAYGWLGNFGFLKDLAVNPENIKLSLFGLVDLTRSAGGTAGFYLPAFVLVVGATVAQYFMGKQTIPESKDARSLKKILKESSNGGKKAGANEIQELLSNGLKYLIPAFIFWFTYSIASAMALYWFVGGTYGYFQQKKILQQDEIELAGLPKPKSKPKKAQKSKNK